VVDTNEWLRQRALRLVKLGFSQKILAAKMDMAPSTLSRWLRQKDEIGPASVAALDGFNAYVEELAQALSELGADAARPIEAEKRRAAKGAR
jgi:transcriptional regulator with XRE-family HTH domain